MKNGLDVLCAATRSPPFEYDFTLRGLIDGIDAFRKELKSRTPLHEHLHVSQYILRISSVTRTNRGPQPNLNKVAVFSRAFRESLDKDDDIGLSHHLLESKHFVSASPIESLARDYLGIANILGSNDSTTFLS